MLMKMELQPGEKRLYALSGKYLLARRIEGEIEISDAGTGLPETVIKQADIVELAGKSQITVQNVSSSQVVIELQSSTVPIRLNDGGNVTVAGGSIDSIRDSIRVEAQATVDGGTVYSLAPNTLNQSSDVIIAPGQIATLLPANPTAKRRVITVQNISEQRTVLRLGDSPTISAGALLAGSLDAIGTAELETTGRLQVRNISNTPATVSLMWSEI